MTAKEVDTKYMEEPAKRWEFASLEDKVINQSKLLETFNLKLEALLKGQVTLQYVDERLREHSAAVAILVEDHRKALDARYGVIRASMITIAVVALTAIVTTAITWLAQRLGG